MSKLIGYVMKNILTESVVNIDGQGKVKFSYLKKKGKHKRGKDNTANK